MLSIISKVDSLEAVFNGCHSLNSLNLTGWDTSNVVNLGHTFNECLSLPSLDLSSWNTENVTSMYATFGSCKAATTINVSTWNTSNVVSMKYTFFNCINLESLNITNFDTRKVNNMMSMFYANEKLTSLDLSNFNTANVTDMGQMFHYCKLLTNINMNKETFTTANVTDMNQMFAACRALTSLDLSNWDTSNVTNMMSMFDNCYELTTIGNVSNWNTGKVTNMGAMFSYCLKLNGIDVSRWNTENVTEMYYLFNECNSLTALNVTNWNTAKVNTFQWIFRKCTLLTELDLSNWVVGNATTIAHMFQHCWVLTTVGDLSNWNTGNVNNMSCMFDCCHKLSSVNVGNWNTGNVNNMGSMFTSCYELTEIDVSNWNVGNVIYMERMFNACSNLTSLDVSRWNTGKVTTLYQTFAACSKLTEIDVSNWNVSNVTNMQATFLDCHALTEIDVSKWNTGKVTNMMNMFNSCKNADIIGVENFNTVNVTTIERMFYLVNNTSLDLSKWNTANMTNISGFVRNSKISSLNVSGWNTSKVTNMSCAFDGCTNLSNLDLSSWDTRNVTNMVVNYDNKAYGMFENCSNLQTIKLGDKWSVAKVNNMAQMFNNCKSLTSLDVSNWDVSNVVSMANMFRLCANLTTLNVSNWNVSNVTNMHHIFHYCEKLTELDVSKWDISNVTDRDNMFQACKSLTEIDVAGFKFSNNIGSDLSKSIHAMFHNCINLKSLDISSWDLSHIPDVKMSVCISALNKAKTIYLPKKHVDVIDIVYSENNVPIHGFLAECHELTTVDFGGVDLTRAEEDLGLFMNNSPKIRYVRCNEIGTLRKIVSYLPTRTVDAPGYLISDAQVSSEITTTLQSKNWNIVRLEEAGTRVATYTFDKSVYASHIPEFNAGYDGYFWDDIVEGNLVTRTIYTLRELPTLIRFGHKWINAVDNAKKANRSHSIISVDYVNTTNMTTTEAMFRACYYLQYLKGVVVTNKVTNMVAMFQHCYSIVSIDTTDWDTSNVIVMQNMFTECERLPYIDLSNFNTSRVTDMSALFQNCTSLTSLDVSNFNTSNVTNMSNMFRNCNKLTSLDVSNFNTSKVTNMSYMFYWLNIPSLDLRNFDTINVETMMCMFDNSPLLSEIKGIEDLNTSKVKDFRQMFFNCNSLKSLDLSKWDVRNGKLFTSMFRLCFDLESLNLSNWNTQNATNMAHMFRGLMKLTSIDVGHFNMSNVTDISWMFAGRDWDTIPSSLVEIKGLENWDTSKVTDMGSMFMGCDKVTELNIGTWNVNRVEGTYSMFNNCKMLNNIDLSNWVFSDRLFNTVFMFRNCYNLQEINLNGFNMSNVQHIQSMFMGCRSIKYLDCSSFVSDGIIPDTSNIELSYLFGDMISLTQLNISQFDINHITEYSNILINTSNLEMLICDKPGTIHKIIPLLPDRVGKSEGIIFTTVGHELDEDCIELMAEKNWVIKTEAGVLVADYIFDPEIYSSLLPVTNEGYLNSCIWIDETIDNYAVEQQAVEEPDLIGVDEYSVMTLDEAVIVNEPRRVIRRKIYSIKGEAPSSIRFGVPYELDSQYKDSNWQKSILELNYLDTSNLTSFADMFRKCENLTRVDTSEFVTENIVEMSEVFCLCKKLSTLIGVEKWNTSNVTDMSALFHSCESLTELDVTNFDTSKVTNMRTMFFDCQSLTSLDLSNFDTSNVWNMYDVFGLCTSLTSLDLSSFNTSKVTDMYAMFNRCYNLSMLDISNFTINEGCIIDFIFNDTSNLKYLKLDDVPTAIELIDLLPNKNSSDKGHLVIRNLERIGVNNIKILNNKNWEVHSIDDCTVVAYAYDNTIHNDLMPIFNEDYDTSALSISEHVHGGYFVHRDVMNFEGKLPTSIKFGGDVADNRTNALMQIGDINLTNISDYSNMFKNCTNLNYLNICVGEKNPTNVSHMFDGCSSLELFDIYRINLDNVTSYESMFAGCNSLCKIRVKDIKNEVFMNILQDETNNFAENKMIVSSQVFDLTDEERSVFTNLDCSLKGMVAHYAYDILYDNNHLPLFDSNFTDYEVFDYLNERHKIMHRTIESSSIPTQMRFGKTYDTSEYNYALTRVYDLYTKGLTTGEYMFRCCFAVLKIDCDWDTSNMNNMICMFSGCQQLTSLDVSSFDTSNVIDMSHMFHCCHKLSKIDVSNFDTSKVTKMTNMFYGYFGTTLDVSGFDTSNVTNMKNMFYDCKEITELDVSNFNTSKVTNMEGMFYNCRLITKLDVSKFDTSNVTNMISMFRYCELVEKIDVSNFDTSKVTNMLYMFYHCKRISSLDLSGFVMNNVENIQSMFDGCSYLKQILAGNWNTSNIRLARGTFQWCERLEYIDMANWEFEGLENFNPDEDMIYFFEESPAVKYIRINSPYTLGLMVKYLPDRSIVTTEEIETIVQQSEPEFIDEFAIQTLELDYEEPEVVVETKTVERSMDPGIIISDAEIPQETLDALTAKNWIVVTSEALTKVAEYVYDKDVHISVIPNCNEEYIDYFINDEEVEGEDVNGVVKTLNKRTIYSLNQLPTMMRFGYPDGDNLYTTKQTSILKVNYVNYDNISNVRAMFRMCINMTDVYTVNMVSNKNTMLQSSFANCYKLKAIDTTGWDTSEIFTYEWTFYRCESITELDVSKFDTSKATTMTHMFRDCKLLESLDVSNFDMSNVVLTHDMFRNCDMITSLDVSNWDVRKVTNMDSMFRECAKLTTIDVSNWKTDSLQSMYSFCSSSDNLISIDMGNWNTSNLTNIHEAFLNCYRLQSLNVSNWDTRKVNNMRDFISDCVSLEHVDLGSFVTDNCTNLMSFLYCNSKWKSKKLKYIDISNFNITERCDYTTMFYQSEEELGGLTDVGMVHCNVRTINIVANLLPVQPITIWIGTHLTADEIASLVQLDHITYSIQLEDSERMLLSSPLLEGDEIKVIDGQLCHVHNMGIYDSTINTNMNWWMSNAHTTDNIYCSGITLADAKTSGIFINNIFKPVVRTILDEEVPYIANIDGQSMLRVKLPKSLVNNTTSFNNWLEKNPLTVVYELAEPWTEVIDIPRANVELDLFTNGSLHMSDPTATITRADTESKAIVVAAQGDSVVNVSNQQGNIELSKEDSAQISVGEITEEFSVRPYVDGKTLVNLMDREGWSKFIHPTDAYGAYVYNMNNITNMKLTISNFSNKPVDIGIQTLNSGIVTRSVTINANSTIKLTIAENENLYSLVGKYEDGWMEDNIHELKNINILEGELSEDEMPDYRISGVRNAFDKYKTSEDKYRVEMVVSNCPFQFGKSGRK